MLDNWKDWKITGRRLRLAPYRESIYKVLEYYSEIKNLGTYQDPKP